jgi:spiro-SPASM protein
MKTIVFLYAGAKSSRLTEKSFDSSSALDRSLVWAGAVDAVQSVYIMTVPEKEKAVRDAVALFQNKNAALPVDISVKVSWTNALLLHELSAVTAKAGVDFAVYASADCPFLDVDLTREVVASHVKYLAEYTFADGWPFGFAPEVIGTGALAILASLADGVQKVAGDAAVSKAGIFSVMKGDVNSFEIETVIAPKDWRQLRLDFSCTEKASFVACKRLFDEAVRQSIPFTARTLTEFAENDLSIQQTVPAFYNVQIEAACPVSCKYCPYPVVCRDKYGVSPQSVISTSSFAKDMNLGVFTGLVSQMVSLSDTAVVGVGAWGEPLLHPQFVDFAAAVLRNPSLSLLVETDGTQLTALVAQKVAALVKEAPVRTCSQPAVTWIISIDAVDEQKYNVLHSGSAGGSFEKSSFKKAIEAVSLLETYFPGDVYPQFLRVNENEDQLEQFYRFWHDKESPSKGKLIIQKYDSFCKKLSDEKPADLAPLDRIPCWHIKRDMTILIDGSVPYCREQLFDGIVGNAFSEGIESVWASFKTVAAQHLNKTYNDKCRICDEYYTFNF